MSDHKGNFRKKVTTISCGMEIKLAKISENFR